jgi:hypothetical protein
MTHIATSTAVSCKYISFFGLANPPSGAQTVTIQSSALDTLGGTEICYTGVKQTGQPEAIQTVTDSASTVISGSVRTVSPYAWPVGTLFVDGEGGTGGADSGTKRVGNAYGDFSLLIQRTFASDAFAVFSECIT